MSSLTLGAGLLAIIFGTAAIALGSSGAWLATDVVSIAIGAAAILAALIWGE